MTYRLQRQKGIKMPTYDIEVIHEPSGTYMNFIVESDAEEGDVWNEVLSDLSVVAFKTGLDNDDE
jgi:hypothetical protein